jgi:hypothetical protein
MNQGAARPPDTPDGPDGNALRVNGNDPMKHQFLALSLGVGAMILATNHAFAQQQNRNCADRARVVERLADGFGESRQSIGLGANNSVIEVFASAETGTWTITVTTPAGLTCLVASGQAFESVDEELTPTGMAL